MDGSSITSNKPLTVFTGTDPEYYVEYSVTAKLILNVGPEQINTIIHKNWTHKSTALTQTTLDGAAQKWFSVLPIEKKTNWKSFTQEFSKCLILKETKNIEEFYVVKFVDYETKPSNNWRLELKH